MDFGQKIHLIKHNFEIEGYTIVAKECVGLIEQAFRQLFSGHLTQLDEKDRLKVQKAELEIGKGEKGIESFTMGQLVGVFRTSRFLDAWAHASGKEISGIRMINLSEINSLRNQLIHEGREATHSEAEFLFNCVQVILETFELVSSEDAKRIFTLEGEHEVIVSESVPDENHQLDTVIALPQQAGMPVKDWRSQVQAPFIESEVVSFPGRFPSYKYFLQTTAFGLVIFLAFFISYPRLLELKALDWKFKIKQRYKTYTSKGQITIRKEKVIIVALGDDFLEGETISREKLARLINRLSARNPKVIGLDVLLDTSKKEDDELIKAMKMAANVIIPFELKAAKNSQKTPEMIFPLPEFHEIAEIGFANFSKHPIDSVIRELQSLRIRAGDRLHYPFAVQILRSFYADKEIETILEGHPEKKNSLRINFDHETQFIVLKPEHIETGAFKDFYYEDKIVLIGYVGEKQQYDTFLTPLSVGDKKMRGVFIHANILNTIDRRQYIRSWTLADLLIVLFTASIGGGVLAKFRWSAKLLILLIIWMFYMIITLCLFIFIRIDIPLWSPMLALTLTTFFKVNKFR